MSVDRELREAWRAVAIAKPTEFYRQCWRLSDLVRQGVLDKQIAVDTLYDIALAHDLARIFDGDDRVQEIMAEAFAEASRVRLEAA